MIISLINSWVQKNTSLLLTLLFVISFSFANSCQSKDFGFLIVKNKKYFIDSVLENNYLNNYTVILVHNNDGTSRSYGDSIAITNNSNKQEIFLSRASADYFIKRDSIRYIDLDNNGKKEILYEVGGEPGTSDLSLHILEIDALLISSKITGGAKYEIVDKNNDHMYDIVKYYSVEEIPYPPSREYPEIYQLQIYNYANNKLSTINDYCKYRGFIEKKIYELDNVIVKFQKNLTNNEDYIYYMSQALEYRKHHQQSILTCR